MTNFDVAFTRMDQTLTELKNLIQRRISVEKDFRLLCQLELTIMECRYLANQSLASSEKFNLADTAQAVAAAVTLRKTLEEIEEKLRNTLSPPASPETGTSPGR